MTFPEHKKEKLEETVVKVLVIVIAIVIVIVIVIVRVGAADGDELLEMLLLEMS